MKKIIALLCTSILSFSMIVGKMDIKASELDTSISPALLKVLNLDEKDIQQVSHETERSSISQIFADGKKYKHYLANNSIELTLKEGKLSQFSRISGINVEKVFPCGKEVVDSKIKALRDVGAIPTGFHEVKRVNNDGILWKLLFFRNNKYQIENPYDSIKLGIDARNGDVIFFTRFDSYVIDENIEKTYIPEKEAREIAAKEIQCLEPILLGLGVYHTDDGAYRVIYRFRDTKHKLLVYVDAENGKVRFVDNYLSLCGRSFYHQDLRNKDKNHTTANNPYFIQSAEALNDIMQTLGYDISSIEESKKQNILNYFKRSDSYAFGFTGHANPYLLETYDNKRIFQNEVFGVWNFVFLNGCETAKDERWLNAFKIPRNNNENKVFLGWNSLVNTKYAAKFVAAYRSRIRNKPGLSLYKVMLETDRADPEFHSSAYTIIFYGDFNTNGRR